MTQQEEPWLRGTHLEIAPGGAGPVIRAVLHSLDMAREDIAKWCRGLDDAEMHARPFHLPSVGFQLRHIVGSLDRLLTYAEGQSLSDEQMAALAGEDDSRGTANALLEQFGQGLDRAGRRLEAMAAHSLEEPVKIGRRALSTTLGGLLVHVAEHMQRHVGQAITTAKLLLAEREAAFR
jgi:uncharacterized damage-inducible protein DinB